MAKKPDPKADPQKDPALDPEKLNEAGAAPAANQEDPADGDEDEEATEFNVDQPKPAAAAVIHPPLPEGSCKGGEYTNNRWAVFTKQGTPFEATLDPSYWANVARKFKPGDRIEVHTEDGTYFGELYVRAASGPRGAGGHWAKVAALSFHRFGAPVGDAGRPRAHRAEWRGAIRQWAVIRIRDGQVVKDGFGIPEDADAWIRDTERTLTR